MYKWLEELLDKVNNTKNRFFYQDEFDCSYIYHISLLITIKLYEFIDILRLKEDIKIISAIGLHESSGYYFVKEIKNANLYNSIENLYIYEYDNKICILTDNKQCFIYDKEILVSSYDELFKINSKFVDSVYSRIILKKM